MWLFTKIGFFSATVADFESSSYKDLPRPVDWETEPYVMVRARVKNDLVRLNEFVGGVEAEIFHLPGHDYPYRTLFEKREWVEVVTMLVEDVNYSNFKNAVTAASPSVEEGTARHDLYMHVWSLMHGAERWLQSRVHALRSPKGKAREQGSFGFWEPSGHFVDPRDDDDMRQVYRSEEWRENRKGRGKAK